MATRISFGTDGWRGRIAEDFTFSNVRRCAQGLSDHLRDGGRTGAVVVGYDTRYAGERFAAAVAEVLAAHGIAALLSQEPVPTPVISYNVLHREAAAGVAITASHNRGEWSGFKYRTAQGGSATPDELAELEERINAIPCEAVAAEAPAATRSQIQRVDLKGPYLRHVGTLVDLAAIRGADLRVIVDPMHGAGGAYLTDLLSGGRLRVSEIRGAPDPLFGGVQPEPIPPHVDALQSAVREAGADLGLASDGDADRLGVVDEDGGFVTQLETYALLAEYLLGSRGLRGALVKTVTTTRMAERLGTLYGIPVFETAVGMKYVAPVFQREDALFAGEESGGYAFRGHIPERDGILAGLYVLDAAVRSGKRPTALLADLHAKVGPHHYRRRDEAFPPDRRDAIRERVQRATPERLGGLAVAGKDRLDGVRFSLEGDAWLLIRFSGTEPLLRIYAEAPSRETVDALLGAGRELAGLEGLSGD